MRKSKWVVCELAALLVGTGCGLTTAHAEQSTGAIADSSGSTLEEVVVTARRREEGVEHVPESITVISEKDFEQQHIQTQSDLQFAVPGLIVRATNSNNQLNYVIRGESVDAYSGSVPGVQPYINEVPISENTSASFYDIENVQVLRGPQGTLFGRNTTGGAVLSQTAEPKDEFGGYVTAEYGNFAHVLTNGALNLPLISDKVLLRVAGEYTSGGAFVRNIYNGEMTGDQIERSGRATLMIKPVDGFSNLTTVQLSSYGGTNAANFPYYVVPCGGTGPGLTCNFSPSVPVFNSLVNSKPGTYYPNYPNGYVYPGGLATLTQFLKSLGNDVVDSNAPFPHQAWNDYVTNRTVYDIAPSITLKNIFGYVYTHAQNGYDDDATPYPILQEGGGVPGGSELQDTRSHAITDEFQVQGKAFDSRFTYILGVFFSKERDETNNAETEFSIIPAADLTSISAFRFHAINEDESYAAFGQLSYNITDQLHLTGGIRGTHDQLSLQQEQGSPFGDGYQSTTEHKPSWTVSLDYQVTQALMAYVTGSGSWRVGGYNPFVPPGTGETSTAAQGGNYFLPETLHSVEGGAKFNGNLGGIPFQLNGDVYNSWVSNIQKTAYSVVAGNITSANVNVPSAEVTGFEGSMQLLPTTWLRLGGQLAYTDARFTNGRVNLYGNLVDFGPYGDTPRWSGAVNAVVTMPLPSDQGTLDYRTDVYAQSVMYFSNLDSSLTPGTALNSYGLVNMRVDWSDPFQLKGVTTSLYVKNLTNKLYYQGGSGAAQGSSAETAVFGQPRMYGVTLKYSF
jgi:iron complex outermembrane receptor protein